MSDIAKSTGYTPVSYTSATAIPGVSLASLEVSSANKITGLVAGENIAGGDACYIKGSDGAVYRSTGTSANAAAVVDGFAAENVTTGEAITLFYNVHLKYSDAGLTPGSSYFLSTTAGAIATAASTGGTTVIARAIDSSRVWVQKSY